MIGIVQCPNKCNPAKGTKNAWLNCPRCGTRMRQIGPALDWDGADPERKRLTDAGRENEKRAREDD